MEKADLKWNKWEVSGARDPTQIQQYGIKEGKSPQQQCSEQTCGAATTLSMQVARGGGGEVIIMYLE